MSGGIALPMLRRLPGADARLAIPVYSCQPREGARNFDTCWVLARSTLGIPQALRKQLSLDSHELVHARTCPRPQQLIVFPSPPSASGVIYFKAIGSLTKNPGIIVEEYSTPNPSNMLCRSGTGLLERVVCF